MNKINKIYKALARRTKIKRKKTQITSTKTVKRSITKVSTQIQRVIRGCYEQFYANKLDSLDEIDNFLERHKLPKL